MLTIIIPSSEQWDAVKQEFVYTKEYTLTLEHSLVSLAKWESKWGKAFLTKNNKTFEETIDYIKCMTITQNVNPKVYDNLTKKNIDDINNYIESPMTATYISDKEPGKVNNEQVTSELIYYWMISLNIPFECQKWHINRLITLIKVCNVKNSPPKKMSKSEIMNRNAQINASRKRKLNTTG